MWTQCVLALAVMTVVVSCGSPENTLDGAPQPLDGNVIDQLHSLDLQPPKQDMKRLDQARLLDGKVLKDKSFPLDQFSQNPDKQLVADLKIKPDKKLKPDQPSPADSKVCHCTIGGGCYTTGASPSWSSYLECNPLFSSTAWDVKKGYIATVAGNGQALVKNGPAHTSSFSEMFTLVVMPGEDVYASDVNAHLIRRFVGGAVSTFAGNGLGDAVGTQPQFNYPMGLAIQGKNLLVADYWNHKTKLLAPNGSATLHVVGITNPMTLAVMGSQVIASGDYRLWDLSTASASPFVGSTSGHQDGPSSIAKFTQPLTLAISSTNYYVGDGCSLRVANKSAVSTVFGPTCGFKNGPTPSAQAQGIVGIAMLGGDVIFTDLGNSRIRWINKGSVVTLAGNGVNQTVDGPLPAGVSKPTGLFVYQSNDGPRIYVAERNRIRMIRQ